MCGWTFYVSMITSGRAIISGKIPGAERLVSKARFLFRSQVSNFVFIFSTSIKLMSLCHILWHAAGILTYELPWIGVAESLQSFAFAYSWILPSYLSAAKALIWLFIWGGFKLSSRGLRYHWFCHLSTGVQKIFCKNCTHTFEDCLKIQPIFTMMS